MKAYVGTYGKYNEGSLEGKWLDLEDYTSYEEFCDACKELHKDEKDPEFMIQDWDLDFDEQEEAFDLHGYYGECLNPVREYYDQDCQDKDEDEFILWCAAKINGYRGDLRDAYVVENLDDYLYDYIEEMYPELNDNSFVSNHFNWGQAIEDLKYYLEYVELSNGRTAIFGWN